MSYARLGFLPILLLSDLRAADYHVDSASGSDTRSGLSPDEAWKTLAKASSAALKPGDRILLRRACRFPGSLALRASGSAAEPIVITAFGDESRGLPVIDAKGQMAAIELEGCSHVEISHLEITGDGVAPAAPGDPTLRLGVSVKPGKDRSSEGIRLHHLHIHDLFAAKAVPHEGRNPTSNVARGIDITAGKDSFEVSDVVIENCIIERTGWYGIRLSGSGVHGIRILDNKIRHTGGSGIQTGLVRDVIVRGNHIEYSGSSADPRMHGRGSGMWTWRSSNILVERNRFEHARGKGDSCGFHIDFGCSDVVAQYNVSIDNEGGFAEILGDCRNCAYRYNLSVNDGSRTRGKDGAHQNGKTLWFSGYVGSRKTRSGPFQSYIYNNTIYLDEEALSNFSIAPTTRGVLVANNIFWLPGPSATSTDDQPGSWKKGKPPAPKAIPGSVFTHNLYARTGTIPKDFPIQDANPFSGSPGFRKPGGTDPADYVPSNAAVVKDRGITIQPLPGDDKGLFTGLAAEKDLMGKPVTGLPDLGAIEVK